MTSDLKAHTWPAPCSPTAPIPAAGTQTVPQSGARLGQVGGHLRRVDGQVDQHHRVGAGVVVAGPPVT
ncbi:hypothetical protein, partial [Mycolicibacterium diernhoferi]|uniref:hypothetical protein n=1 Tax=Mycolicibacterium diernhoferi TaxID=1801 RepID=UPI00197C6745